MRSSWPVHDRRDLHGSEPNLERAANGDDCRCGRRSVGGVASEQDPARRREREQGKVVGRVPPGGVEEEVRVVVEPPPDPGEVGDADERKYERRLWIPLAERQRVAAE
jgi:hypothetical protein